jgi:hypothetical protein
MIKNNVAFFGASITQQQNGYWYQFGLKNPELNIKPFGYGSMHLNDAGISYIDDVLVFNPEICFIDWFSTGYVKYNEDKFEEIIEYINTIIYKFYKNNTKLVFLTFPDKTVDKTNIYFKINEYLKSLNVPVLDISNSFDNISEILRDGIHTTQLGSEEYARLIDEYYHTVDISIPETYPSENKYCVIKKLTINSTINEYIKLNGPCEIIGISQEIGPNTGLLDIDGVLVNNWDRWCYYQRKMVNLKFKVNDETLIKVLQDNFDRSLCEHQINWPINKYLQLETIYYISGDLTIIDYK